MTNFTEEKIKEFRENMTTSYTEHRSESTNPSITIYLKLKPDISIEDLEDFITQAISEAREEEKQKHLTNLRVMLDLGDEIIEEAIPNYEDNDNEVYTIVDWQMNARKLRKLYPKDLTQKQLKK